MSSTRSATSYKVTIGGQEFTQPEADGLEQLVLEDHVDMVAYLSARISGMEGGPEWKMKMGDPVEVRLGAGDSLLFKGEVTALEPNWGLEGVATMNVRALDNTHRLGRGRKTRWFKDKKDSEIAQSVGAECNLSVEVDDTQEMHPYTLQRNESNLGFLKRLAARNNHVLSVEEGKLIFKKASLNGSGATLEYGKDIRSIRMQFNAQDQVSKVVVRGWDVREKKEIVGTATAGDIETIGGGQKGAELANSKFGESVAYITDVPVGSQAEANALAKAEMNRLARQFCHGTCVAEGNDKLRAGASVEVKGLKGGHNGAFFIVSSRHTISATSGYLTEFQFISNTLGS
jgi:phage protein D